MKNLKGHIAKKTVSVGLSLALTVGTFGLGFKSPITKAYADQDNQVNNPSVQQKQPTVSDADNTNKTQTQLKKQALTNESTAQPVASQKNTSTNETPTPIKYMDWNDSTKQLEEKTLSDYKVLSGGDRNLTNDKWYVVKGNVTHPERMYCWGNDIHVVLMDGCLLDAKHGIDCSEGGKITIHGQQGQSGKLIAKGNGGDAGIGGFNERQNSGTVVINGGEIDAIGGEKAAGIGGGNGRVGKNITINGGKVNATGGKYGAGIGGGTHGEGTDITINGGTVTAKAGHKGASIGGGSKKEGQRITINGGNVVVNSKADSFFGVNQGAGIGGGDDAGAQAIQINGGTVNATGGSSGAAIGGGHDGTADEIIITGGIVEANGGSLAAGIGSGEKKDANDITILGGNVTAIGGTCAAGIGAGYNGDVYGIKISNGEVRATGGSNGAGIGCSRNNNASNIEITGGNVIAEGGELGAGIGSGKDGKAFNIRITGGTVKATGAKGRCCIGGTSDESTSVFVDENLLVHADNRFISHKSEEDIASKLVPYNEVDIFKFK